MKLFLALVLSSFVVLASAAVGIAAARQLGAFEPAPRDTLALERPDPAG
jgi:hypothetical protein